VVLKGRISIEFPTRVEHLGEGDYIAFDASEPHRIVNDSEAPARVLWFVLHERHVGGPPEAVTRSENVQ
jgi:glyoxylate utilization-related uncharacterized protein